MNATRSLVRACRSVDVEHALGQAPEKPRGAVLEDGAARAEQTGVGREHLAELDEVVLVAAGAVEQQQRARIVALRRQVAMNVRLEARLSASEYPSTGDNVQPSYAVDGLTSSRRFDRSPGQVAVGRPVLQDALAGDGSGRRRQGRGERRARQAGESGQAGRRDPPSPRPYEHILIVRELAERRGPASVAQRLYEETRGQPRRARSASPRSCKMAPAAFVYEEKGRPTKKDRRDLSKFIDRKRR